MNSELTPKKREREGGFVLVAVSALVLVLLATGLAFMRWSVDESLQSMEQTAAMQAYYLAQMGIVEQGFAWLRQQDADMLPLGVVNLPGRVIPDVGKYEDVVITYVTGGTGGDIFSQKRRYAVSAVGVVRQPIATDGGDAYKDIRRKAVLYIELRTFADYMYLSNNERTRFGDQIKFWHGDTLRGRVHSNDTIAIMQDPVFYGQVTTPAPDFWRGIGYAPVFRGPPPIFRAKRVLIPDMAQLLRDGASAQGNFYSYPGKTIRARFRNSSVDFWKWDTGTPFDSSDYWNITLGPSTCIFVEGPLEIYGIVAGKVTIGARDNIRILDNIRYADAHPLRGDTPLGSPNFLGIVSEADVKVANTPANGRENSSGRGRQQTNPDSTDVVITAAVVALGESFTFENQNDPDSGYVCSCIPDDRGTIWLYGSLTQRRRGYVHRSNRNSTGYLKQYRYDMRLLRERPPCFIEARDEENHALFNILQWGQGYEYPPERLRGNIVRYN